MECRSFWKEAGRRSLLGALLVLWAACGGTDGPVEVPDVEETPLDVSIRTQDDITWDDRLVGRDISWRMHSSRSLARSISVIGTFGLTLVNTDSDVDLRVTVVVRLQGANGEWHVPETPILQVLVPAGGSLSIDEAFIVEVKDRSAANDLARIVFSFS